jgi:hypothetical protein
MLYVKMVIWFLQKVCAMHGQNFIVKNSVLHRSEVILIYTYPRDHPLVNWLAFILSYIRVIR